MARPKTYFPQLTSVRAIGAYCVFIQHYHPIPLSLWDGWPAAFVEQMHVCLWMFYVLSGFIIFYRYAEDFAQWSTAHMWQYAKNRVARIYPVYYLLLLVTYLVYEFPPPNLALVQMTLTQGFFPQYAATGIAQAWSLTVEECFYFTAPLLFFIARRWTLLIPCLLLPIIGAFLDHQSGTPFALLRTILGAITAFGTGAFLALKWMDSKPRPRRLPIAWVTYSGSLAIAGVVFGMSITSGPPNIALQVLVLPVAIAWWFWGLISEQSLLRMIMTLRFMVLLGNCSYSFYLLHLGATAELFQAIVSDRLLILFPALVVMSLILHKLVEHPANEWLRNLGRPKSKKRIPADPLPDDSLDRAFKWFGPGASFLAMVALVFVCILPWQAQFRSRVLQVRAAWLISEQRFDEAFSVAARSEALMPDNLEAAVLTAQANFLRQNYSEATAQLRDIVASDPACFDAHYYLGLSLMQASEVETALKHLRKAVELQPKNAEYRMTLGLLALNNRRLDEATAQFTVLVRLQPHSANSHYLLAKAYLARGQLDDARLEIEEALHIAPKHKESRELQTFLEQPRT